MPCPAPPGVLIPLAVATASMSLARFVVFRERKSDERPAMYRLGFYCRSPRQHTLTRLEETRLDSRRTLQSLTRTNRPLDPMCLHFIIYPLFSAFCFGVVFGSLVLLLAGSLPLLWPPARKIAGKWRPSFQYSTAAVGMIFERMPSRCEQIEQVSVEEMNSPLCDPAVCYVHGSGLDLCLCFSHNILQ